MINNRYKESNRLIEEALKVIPLGSQTFSKSITLFPKGVSPLFLEQGNGSRVWDVDGNEYIDFVNGLCSITLGYNDKGVNNAIASQLKKGINFSLPHKLEMEVAQLIIELVPTAEMVRFGKNGTDSTSASIRLARAYTNREHVAVCGYHGWQDWYIGSTTRDLGVPKSVSNLTHNFKYNDLDSLRILFDKHPEKIAAVIMEPMNNEWPKNDFLHRVQEITKYYGAVFILDENITGFRYSKGGAQELFGLSPDLSTFGKGMGNGCPLSALTGKKEIMMWMDKIFYSGTFAGETISLSAAKEVLTRIRDTDILEHMSGIGSLVIKEITKVIDKNSLSHIISIVGHPTWSLLVIKDYKSHDNLKIRTLIMQEMFKRGVLVTGTHNISYAHNATDVKFLVAAYDEVFSLINTGLETGTLDDYLEVDSIQQLFTIR